MFMVIVGTVDQLIDGLSFMSFIFYTLCIVAVLILRVTHHKEPRLFKVWHNFKVDFELMCSLVCGLVQITSLIATYIPMKFNSN